MVKSIKSYVKRSNHYGAQGNEEFSLMVAVQVDAAMFTKLLKKKQDPTSAAAGMVNPMVHDLGIYSVPYVDGARSRASKGVKTLQFQYFISKEQAQALGADTKQWCLYHPVKLSRNVTFVDFKNKSKIA